MEPILASKLNTIEEAIKSCEKNIEQHRTDANLMFKIIVFTLLVFGIIQLSFLLQTVYNRNAVSEFKIGLDSLGKHIKQNTKLVGTQYNNLIHHIDTIKAVAFPGVPAKSTNFAISKFIDDKHTIDTLMMIKDKYELALSKLNNGPQVLNEKFFKIDNSIAYIIYGIFILVFGVLTSFYRFHLKEVSKYEHFLFGFERIRIAGNNSEKGYETEVRVTLTKDAFVNENKVENKIISKRSVESPLPGHPTSDVATLLLNKILNSVEVVPKNKDEGNINE